MDSREGGATVSGWGSKDTPCVYANAGEKLGLFLDGAIRVPPRSIAVHPDQFLATAPVSTIVKDRVRFSLI
jgi:hypothetical protein